MKIWITQYALDKEGVIVVEVPDELIPGPGGRFLKLPREILTPWRGKGILFNHEIYDWHWHRSESTAKAAVKREIERRIRRAKRDLENATRALEAFRASGMPFAKTIAEKKAERGSKKGTP